MCMVFSFADVDTIDFVHRRMDVQHEREFGFQYRLLNPLPYISSFLFRTGRYSTILGIYIGRTFVLYRIRVVCKFVRQSRRCTEVVSSGSWLLIGSFLMYSTALKRIHEYNPFLKSSALFWGSSCFLGGSMCFAMDADSSGLGARENGIVGYILFTLGRIFFIRGSQTQRCGVLFINNTAR